MTGYLAGLRQGVRDASPLELTDEQADATINAMPNTILISWIDAIDEQCLKGF